MPSFGEVYKDVLRLAGQRPKKKVPPPVPNPPGPNPFGMDPTAGLPTSNPTSIDDLLRAGQGVGTPLTPGVDYGPGSLAALAAGPADPFAATRTALQRALSYLGGGPDRNAYIAPFDQAAQRAQDAYNAAVPNIAQQYAQLTSGLSQHEQDYQAQAAATQQAQRAAVDSQQQLLQRLQAPVAADLAAQGGNAAVGSLTGAVQAAMAAGQANLGQQGLAQQQLSQNLQNAQRQSYDSRIQDTQVAQQAAQGNASANLNSILNQIGLQRANAEKQYAADAQGFQGQRQQIELQLAQLQDQAAQQSDPLAALQRQAQALQLQNTIHGYTSGQVTPITYLQQTRGQQFPVSVDWLSDAFAGNKGDLDSVLVAINHAADKNGQIKYKGKRLDANTLRNWATEAARASR